MQKHELEYNLDMLAPLGIRAEKTTPKIYLSKTETESVETLLKQHGLSQADLKIVVHPGGGGSSLKWGAGKFAELAVRLKNRLAAKVILTGVEKERHLTRKVAEAMDGDAFDWTGKLNLRDLCATISKADLVVTNSTGPMHIATAVGVNVVALFCPIRSASAHRWGPYGQDHHVLLPPVKSCTCSVVNCRRGNCMDLITVDQVFGKVESVLLNRKSGVQNR